MKLLFFGTKSYDKKYLLPYMEQEKYADIKVKFIEAELTPNTAMLARGYDAVCAFVNMDVGTQTVELLNECGVRLILMRCAGYNNVDLEAAKKYGIRVAHVPGYSPESVAEHAMALALTANRHLHKAYIKVRENNYSLTGLLGVSFYGRTAGIVGTGRIGAAMARICQGFGMHVIAYDMYPNKSLDFVEYVSLEELLRRSDLISLHCPLTPETHHMINIDTIGQMKDGVILVNTSRGGLIKTEDLVRGIRENKFFAVGLDVYEEENGTVYEDMSDEIMQHSTVARLLSFPNVIVTSHQGFFTEEAMQAISETTMENALAFEKGEKGPNELF
ncbi:MAG: 2-hydroxyacid dehydrogenase [Lachnospiraceae bacterium]|nr:2-hydroxyacid dehydrogenase [Clostridiales bacterium]MCD7716336.1 2-hydroxyacid dehydrogenase [Lachnospiraceae bacterium]MCD7841819.1 2-hydroxyacid dehydrogenase [Lachnospiraceae bacterium]